jgi:hypothetical protein
MVTTYLQRFTNMILQQIYNVSFLGLVYHYLKSVYGFLTGTSELFRICDAFVTSNELGPTAFTGNHKTATMIECRKLQLDPEILFRLDLCVLYSSRLDDDFRKPFESWYLHLEENSDAYLEAGTGDRFEEIFEFLLQIKKFPFPKDGVIAPQVLVLRAGLTEIVSTFHLLHELNKRASSRYIYSLMIDMTCLW